jgi:hypothetical protein
VALLSGVLGWSCHFPHHKIPPLFEVCPVSDLENFKRILVDNIAVILREVGHTVTTAPGQKASHPIPGSLTAGGRYSLSCRETIWRGEVVGGSEFVAAS